MPRVKHKMVVLTFGFPFQHMFSPLHAFAPPKKKSAPFGTARTELRLVHALRRGLSPMFSKAAQGLAERHRSKQGVLAGLDPSLKNGSGCLSTKSPSMVAIDWWCPLKLPLLEVPKREMAKILSYV